MSTTSYRIWQSPESMMIQAGGGSIELPVADAIALAADITAQLTPAQLTPAPLPASRRPKARWTPELSAECVRLYVEEEMSQERIAKRIGATGPGVRGWLIKAGVQMRRPNANLIAALAALAAKRARAA